MTPFQITCIALLGTMQLSILIAIFRQGFIMATLQELQTSVAALAVEVARAVPVLEGAGGRIDPAALDPIKAAIDAETTRLAQANPPQ